jgi:polysaccharide export outer membrane protein
MTTAKPCMKHALACGLALAALAGCAATALDANAERTTLSTRPDWSDFPIGPQDLLRVGVYGHPELSTESTRVDMEGKLSLPLIGPVDVDGLSVSAARARITAAFAQFVREPMVDLSIVEHGARRVYVFGEVAKPGAIVLDRPLNVLQALSLAEGLTSKADRSEIVLLRGDAASLEIAVIDATEPTTNGLLALRADDIVFVRRSNAGKFSDEILPYLQGLASSLSSAATIVLLDDRLND